MRTIGHNNTKIAPHPGSDFLTGVSTGKAQKYAAYEQKLAILFHSWYTYSKQIKKG
jgi:hypothetical protein